MNKGADADVDSFVKIEVEERTDTDTDSSDIISHAGDTMFHALFFEVVELHEFLNERKDRQR